MGYSNNNYNYQVAVIFAILVGALLLLGLVLGGIYIVTKSMRGDDENKKRAQSRANSYKYPSQAPAYRPPSAQMYQPPQQQQNQSFDFAPRSVAASPALNVASYNNTPYNQAQQYSQQPPLVTPVTQEYVVGNRVPQQDPDVIYTQGPTGFVRSTPVEYTQTPSYHQSSV